MEEKHIGRHSERNYGIDLLRLVSMFMVVVLHVLGHGGVLRNADGNAYNAAWLLQITCFCAVDCFALITGYVSWDKSYKVSRYLLTWVQASFYSFLITALFFLIQHSVGIGTLAFSVFPVFSKKYWYLSAFTGMYLLMPILNMFVQTASEKTLDNTVLLLLFSICIYSQCSNFMFGGDLFVLNSGYCFVWVSILYVVGAWLCKKKYRPIRSRWIIVVIVFIIATTWMVTISDRSNDILKTFLVSYCSPSMVGIAILLTIVFSRIRPSGIWKKVIGYLAPSAFSVYLIHEYPLFRATLIKDHFSWIAEANPVFECVWVIGIAFFIFGACMLIDIVIRRPVFKTLKVNAHIEKLTKHIDHSFD